ncbi:MAG: undecaprenyldiphospho-muramoylpentapeptide beta-N-acetylglucosaminyltransferase [Oscillospiraceae bacterium]|nr:undecaprenyldiphospho-muramoylpentapeptide beta-N-acetylglucosaminyltransferase [Oscillospiraceae bacterium]
MRVIITAGGTAGHIHPAIAIADEIRKQQPDSDILFIGRSDGMEKSIVTENNYPFEGIKVHGFMRRFSITNILFNIRSLYHIFTATRASRKIFKSFKPDIVIGCGGYVSGPVVRAAAKKHIKTVIHEQNSYPGITTRLLEKHVDLVLCPDLDSTNQLKYKEKAIVVGNPVNSDFFTANREKIRSRYSVGDRVFVLSYGGSNGSEGLNKVVAAFMALHNPTDSVFHVHATGAYAKESFARLMKEYQIDPEESRNIKVFEYISDMADYYAAADLIISRAGALTVSEIKARGVASVLIPSPNVTENHQLYNALSLAKIDAAYVFEEAQIDNDKLATKVLQLTDDKEKLQEMGANAKQDFSGDAALLIYQAIKGLLNGV